MRKSPRPRRSRGLRREGLEPPHRSSKTSMFAGELVKPQQRRTLVLSHNELAQLGGMSRPHVTVTMGRLRRRGLVDTEREGVVRVDVASLTDYLGRVVRTRGRNARRLAETIEPNRPSGQRTA